MVFPQQVFQRNKGGTAERGIGGTLKQIRNILVLTLVQSSGTVALGCCWIPLAINRRHAPVMRTVLEPPILQNILVVVLYLRVQQRFQREYAFTFQFGLENLVLFLVVRDIREELFDGPFCGEGAL